ncbi:MAG: hypothetical protein HYZ81_12575 [Nitrospinae bacterium]|nr:hypothetical protein [Nitrospinota bacterium]
MREGEDPWQVHGCALPRTQATDGTLRYHHALATSHPGDRTRVEAVVRAGRARWNIEPDTNTTLTTTGDHLAQHDGHGQPHLSAV